MDKYEISLWEDYRIPGEHFFRERKIAVIGSDTMEAQARAIEPNLVEEINGSNTFTFKMFYTYTDNQTGEKYPNPFGKYLVNERKVKVFWKDKWYDFVIKKCQEDSSKKSVTYTCKDLFINELSKQGYSLEFDTELENNIGTAAELAKQVLDGSTWQYDDEASTPIIQRTEGPVYECTTWAAAPAIIQSPNGDTEIEVPAEKLILVFYDSLVNLFNITGNTTAAIQFLYGPNGYITDVNDMVVINGDCCESTFVFSKENNILTASIDGTTIFTIDLAAGVSNQYTAKRLIKSQLTVYDSLLDRYVNICKDQDEKTIYEINETEYSNPLAVINLVANPSDFTNVAGWIGEQVERFSIFPKFDSTTEVASYEAKSYLKLNQGDIYNTGIQSNISYFKPTDLEKKQGNIGGIQKDEKYIFRLKARNVIENSGEPDLKNYVTATDFIESETNKLIVNLYKKDSQKQIKIFGDSLINNNETWVEVTLVAEKSVSANDLYDYELSFFTNINLWVEEVQFFKYVEGTTSYDEQAQIKRINPGEINLQSIAESVFKYYYPNPNISNAEDMIFEYVGEEENINFVPVYNNYEKIGTISEKESNRFNILQTIAETFQVWVKFRIDHNDDGSIKLDEENKPQKYVYFIEELENDNGLSFEYGIDLKTITRTIDSDKLATKIIINPNNNEFGKNGFCSIARSDENYSKENFILNLDYFIQQNLLDKDSLNEDLYSTNGIGYYYWLHNYNTEYDNITDELSIKQIDLIRQSSQEKVYEQYLLAATQQLKNIQSDLISLAGVNSWSEVEGYAQAHIDNEKVQSLLNSYAQTQAEITSYQTLLNEFNGDGENKGSLQILSEHIDSIITRQQELINNIRQKHKQFNDKYTNYIMEGTWQDDQYIDDTKYYLDGIKVAYTSSRPQLSYSINVLRLSRIEEFSSKVFNLGDICYIQDREFFGYLQDKITPYKEKILVSKISTFFDQPEQDVLTVQNYKTRFDDLFQRIAASSQSLQYAEGSYQRAADSITTEGTVDVSLLQNTFDQNQNLILTSSNQNVVWDDTGITVTDKFNSADKTKILAGGIFITNDGGVTWKNAIRGDGISTELLTAGRINTSEIYIYDGNAPSFRWDSYGLTAYSYDNNGVNFDRFVRFDKYGIYGYDGGNFVPDSEQAIWNRAKFGLTWSGFFLKSEGNTENGSSIFEISTEHDLTITQKSQNEIEIPRVKIGRLEGSKYGMALYNFEGKPVFFIDNDNASVQIGGWTVGTDSLYIEKTDERGITGTYLNSDGTINAQYVVDTETVETIIQSQIIITDNYGMAELGPGTFDYSEIEDGSTININVDSISEEVICTSSGNDVIAQTTSTVPMVTLVVNTNECYATANSSFNLSATRKVQQANQCRWAIDQKGFTIDDDNAVIAIGRTVLDATGIYGNNWALDVGEGLKYQEKPISIFNLNVGIDITKGEDLNSYITPGIFEYAASSSITTIIEQQVVNLDENGEGILKGNFNYYNLSHGDIVQININGTEEEVTLTLDSNNLIATTTTTIPQITLDLDNNFCVSSALNSSFTISGTANISPKNMPTNDSAKLSVMKITEDCTVQTLYQIDSMNEYRRYYNGGQWSDWQCITGALTLDSACYGSALPSPGIVGRVFFVEI